MKRLACIAAIACLPALAAEPARPAPRPAQAVVRETCLLCHGPGIGGAPRQGDAKAWRQRVERGLESLVRSAAEGKGAMPPRGGVPDLTDEELRAVVAYLSGISR